MIFNAQNNHAHVTHAVVDQKSLKSSYHVITGCYQCCFNAAKI